MKNQWSEEGGVGLLDGPIAKEQIGRQGAALYQSFGDGEGVEVMNSGDDRCETTDASCPSYDCPTKDSSCDTQDGNCDTQDSNCDETRDGC